MSHERTDPILLTAVCKFANDILEYPAIRDDVEEMRPYHERMQSLKYMIPYLGFEKYPDLLEMTQRYHKAENPEPKVQGQEHDDDDVQVH